LDYFEAVREGRARVQKAVDLLQRTAGPSYPMLFLKVGSDKWTPVGEEVLFAMVLGKPGTAAISICDVEGNSKAMTPWIPTAMAEEHARSLAAAGVTRFEGVVRLPI